MLLINNLEAAELNQDIFNLTPYFIPKIIVKEPHGKKDTIKYHDCQD